jgi:ABC-2 type transport system ATP-binding protein
MTMDMALEINGLRKEYKGFSLKDVSFSLPQGFIMGLVGPNGAGKTTIIKLVMNLIRRKAGEVKVFGLDNLGAEAEIKSRIGFVHETPSFFEDVSLQDIKAAVSLFYKKWDEKLFRSLIGEFALPLQKKFKKLSHGMKMKFSIALALSHDADFLIMDEPTAGLDPVFRRELLERLSGLMQNERKSILFSTHITSDLERTADYITFIHQGELVFSLAKDEIRDKWGIVKGGKEILTESHRKLFKSLRETSYGVEALTSNISEVRRVLNSGAVIEKASIEDIMIFMDKGEFHA